MADNLTMLVNKKSSEGTWTINNGDRVDDVISHILSSAFECTNVQIEEYRATSNARVTFKAKIHKMGMTPGNGRFQSHPEFQKTTLNLVGEMILSAATHRTASYTPVLEFRTFARVYYREVPNAV